MSLKNTQKIKCPDCGTEGEFTIWQSINTKLNPGFLAFGEAGFLTFSEAIFLSGVVAVQSRNLEVFFACQFFE